MAYIIFAFIVIFRCFLSVCEKAKGGRFLSILFYIFFCHAKNYFEIPQLQILPNFRPWSCEKSPARRFFAVLVIFAVLFHVNDYKVESCSCRRFFVVRCIAGDLKNSIFSTVIQPWKF